MVTLVNASIGSWYPRGQARLIESISRVQPDVTTAFHSTYPAGCPTHTDKPYAFKPYCLKIEADKFESGESSNNILIWLDSAVVLSKPLDKIVEIIKTQGYWFHDNGWNNAQWCSDKQLSAFNFTRDEAEQQVHIMACWFGIDLSTSIGKTILAEYYNNVNLFTGSWTNDNLTESADPRCLGSRHDQSILSLICAKYGLTITSEPGLVAYGLTEENLKSCELVSQGM